MDQNLCFNIFIFLIILVIIKYISPNPDSVLFVIKKYLNFLIFKINRFIKQLFNCNEDFNSLNDDEIDDEKYDETNEPNESNDDNVDSIKKDFNTVTFKGMNEFQDNAPTFTTYYQTVFIEKMIEKNPLLDERLLKKLYTFIEKMVTIDVDDYFLSVSDSEQQIFSENELNKIKTIIFNKLNSGSFKFTDLNIQGPVVYYNNLSGKEVMPFSFTVNCDNNIGLIQIYISIDIRNDIIRNASYIIIKKLRINITNNGENIPEKYSENIPEKYSENIVQPLYFDNPDNINLKFTDSPNYNIDINQLDIPNYDDILNSYDSTNYNSNSTNYNSNDIINSYNNEYNVLLDNKNSNTVNLSIPLVDFSKHIKTQTNYDLIEPSNNNDILYNILDNK